MKRRGLVAAAIAVAMIACGGAAYLVHVVRSVDTPEFRQSILDRASAVVGAKVQARQIAVSLWRGVTVEGVRVGNPPPFAGDLLTTDALVLRYNPWALLSGRVELSRLAIRRPVVTLAMDARGSFNYEHLGASAPASPGQGPSGLPVALVLSKLSVEGARLVVRDPRAAFFTVEDADLGSSVRIEGGALLGAGSLSLGLVNLADSLFVRNVSAPFKASRGQVVIGPIRGTLAKGSVRGDARIRLQDGLGFTTNASIDGAQVQEMLAEAKSAQSASGTLVAKAVIGGSGGLATLKGKGHAEVKGCRVAHAAVLTLLSSVLRVPELAHPDFEECRMDFTLGDGRLVTPMLVLKGASIQLTGHGVARLDTLALDYDMTLALGKALLDRIPVRELRAGFKDRADGFGTIDFKVTGTTTAPQTDLSTRIGKAAASEAAESGLKRLLKKGKIF
jgi:AsmA-like C-terminal region